MEEQEGEAIGGGDGRGRIEAGGERGRRGGEGRREGGRDGPEEEEEPLLISLSSHQSLDQLV